MYLTVLLVARIGSCNYYTSSRVAENSVAAGGVSGIDLGKRDRDKT